MPEKREGISQRRISNDLNSLKKKKKDITIRKTQRGTNWTQKHAKYKN
jgi:hypothetical protein